MKNSSFVFRSTKRKRVSLVTPKQKQRREKKQGVKGWKENPRDSIRNVSFPIPQSLFLVKRFRFFLTAFSLFLPSFSIEQILAYILDYFLSPPSLFFSPSFSLISFGTEYNLRKRRSNRIESNRIEECSRAVSESRLTV